MHMDTALIVDCLKNYCDVKLIWINTRIKGKSVDAWRALILVCITLVEMVVDIVMQITVQKQLSDCVLCTIRYLR